jgi:hypothetical protein
MINMIAYISVPYTLADQNSQRDAVTQANKQIARLFKTAPQYTGVNAIYNSYITNQPVTEVPDFKSLISACDVFVIVGRQFTPINEAELAFANSLQKPVIFEETI